MQAFARFRLICLLTITLGLSHSAVAITVFEADFEGSTPNISIPVVPDDDGLGGGSETNANAGTAIGSWTGNNANNLFGGVFANAGGTNNALLIDSVLAGNASTVDLDFASSIDLTTNTTTFEFDILASRQGTGRRFRIAFDDETLGTDADTGNAYQLLFEHADTKSFGFRGDDGANQFLGSANAGSGDSFINPTDGGGNAPTPPDEMIHVKFQIFPGLAADGLGKLFVDWDGDGNFTTNTADVTDINGLAIEARKLGLADLDRVRFIYNGSGARGVWLDNLTISSEVGMPLVDGDVDGDGFVEGVTLNPDGTVSELGDDLGPIVSNFFTNVTSREEGDLVAPFGLVDFADFREWKDNAPTPLTQAQIASIFNGAITVPEPSTGLLLAGLMLVILGQRQARRWIA